MMSEEEVVSKQLALLGRIDWVLLGAYPSMNLSPPPAVGSRLGVNFHHITLLQRQLAGVAGAEVVPRDGHTNHFWS